MLSNKGVTMKIFLTLLLVSLYPICSFGECTDIISLSKLSSTTVENRNRLERHARNFCNVYSRSSSRGGTAQYGISYNVLSASMGSSNVSADTVASEYCDNSSGFTSREDAYEQYIETIAPGAYSAYEKCIEFSRNDVIFTLDPASVLANQFTLTVEFTSRVRNATAEFSFSASNDVRCKWNNSNSNEFVMQVGSTTLKCERDDTSRRSYVTVIRSNSTQSTITVPWQAYSNGVPTNLIVNLNQEYSNFVRSFRGAIAAFDSERCPDGWEPFNDANGRVIIGAGASTGLTTRNVDETGGVETHTLTTQELPTHKHKTVEAGDSSNSTWGVSSGMNGRHGVRWQNPFATSYTEPVGGNKPHENMPPFFVLQYCRKL